MKPRFEDSSKKSTVGREPKGRAEIHEARRFAQGIRESGGADVQEANATMAEIYRNKEMLRAYREVGFHIVDDEDGTITGIPGKPLGKEFLAMMDKWAPIEGDEKPIDDRERKIRDRARMEFVTRMGIVKSCEKLLTPALFNGLKDANSVVNRLVGDLGEEWALNLIKPRLIRLVGEPDAVRELTRLWQSLRNFHGMYETKGFKKVYSKIERYREEYGITPQKWAEIQLGGERSAIEGRAFAEFQKQHGRFGRLWYTVPEKWHAMKISRAGSAEEKAPAMRALRAARAEALDIIGRVLGDDFQEVVDAAIKTGNKSETNKALKEQDAKEAEHARGLTPSEIKSRITAEWEEHIKPIPPKRKPDPALNNKAEYDRWLEDEFMPKYESGVTAPSERSWVARMLKALFAIRIKEVPDPKFA